MGLWVSDRGFGGFIGGFYGVFMGIFEGIKAVGVKGT